MQVNIFLISVICIGMVLPSIAIKYDELSIVNPQNPLGVPSNPKKINEIGEYQPYNGYSIIAKIDTELENVARRVEQLLQSSRLTRSYSPLPASTYHTTIYTIANRTLIPSELLERYNNRAMCYLERYQNAPLHIKYANLNIGNGTISVKLELQSVSTQRVRSARKELALCYENQELPMEKLHITLAYAYEKIEAIDVETWNQLNELVRSFNGAKLLPPSVYGFESMEQYYPFEGNTDCSAELT